MLRLHQPQLIQGSLLQLGWAKGKRGACELCSIPPLGRGQSGWDPGQRGPRATTAQASWKSPFLLGLLLSPHPQSNAAPQALRAQGSEPDNQRELGQP